MQALSRKNQFPIFFALIALLLLLSGCASSPDDDDDMKKWSAEKLFKEAYLFSH